MVRTRIISGLYWDETSVQLCQARHTAHGIDVLRVCSVPLDVPHDTPDDLRKKIISIISDMNQKYALHTTTLRTAVPQSHVFLRKITVPPATQTEIRAMLYFEAEKYIPFPSDDAVVDFYPLMPIQSSSANDIILVAAKKDFVNAHCAILEAAGLFPERISVSSLAFHQLFSRYAGDAPSAVLALHSDSVECVVSQAYRLIFSRGVEYRSEGHPIATEDIARELHHSMVSFNTVYPSIVLNNVLLLGDTRAELIDTLTHTANIPVTACNVHAMVKNDPSFTGTIPDDIERYAIPLGLVLLDTDHAITLIPETKQKAVQRMRTRSMIRLCAIIVGSIACIAVGWYFFANYHALVAQRAFAKKMKEAKPMMRMLEQKANQLHRVQQFSSDALMPLEMIRVISTAFPKNAYLLQMRYDEKQSLLTLRGRTNSYATAADIIARLVKEKQYFVHVVNKGAHTIKFGDVTLVDFEIECMLRDEQCLTEK